MSRVIILNSAGATSTSMKHAKNHVSRKRAVWVKASQPTIKFYDYIQFAGMREERKQAAIRKNRMSMGATYDAGADSLATPAQISGIPTTGRPETLYQLGRKGDWAWSEAVWDRPRQNANNNDHARRYAR